MLPKETEKREVQPLQAWAAAKEGRAVFVRRAENDDIRQAIDLDLAELPYQARDSETGEWMDVDAFYLED